MERTQDHLQALVRTIPDFPRPGVQFRDVTTLLADPRGFRATIDRLAAPYRDARVDVVAGIEARGFILGGAVADRLRCGFVPVRKKGKLPGKTLAIPYALEYGQDTLEIHVDAVRPGARVLLLDDLIATGGTADAARALVERAGGLVVGAAFVVDLPDLGGLGRLAARGVPCSALMRFEGE